MIFLNQIGIFSSFFQQILLCKITYGALLEMLLQVVGWKLHSTKFVNEYKFLILVIVMKNSITQLFSILVRGNL
jgi:hypothetical protein